MKALKFVLLGFGYHTKQLFCRIASRSVALFVVLSATAMFGAYSMAPPDLHSARVFAGAIWAGVPFLGLAITAHHYNASEQDDVMGYVNEYMCNWPVASLNAVAVFASSGLALTFVFHEKPAPSHAPFTHAAATLAIAPMSALLIWAVAGMLGLLSYQAGKGLYRAYCYYHQLGKELSEQGKTDMV